VLQNAVGGWLSTDSVQCDFEAVALYSCGIEKVGAVAGLFIRLLLFVQTEQENSYVVYFSVGAIEVESVRESFFCAVDEKRLLFARV